MISANYLIIGSGIAGLSLAIKLAEQFPNKKVFVVTKKSDEDSNTRYAQGGIAVVKNNLTDSFEKHIEDTLVAGAHANNPEVVEMVVREAPDRLQEMIDWGAHFDRADNGTLDLGKEGGHSEERIVHHKDITGYEMAQSLIARCKSLSNITVFENYFAVDLITPHHTKSNEGLECYGVYVLNRTTLKIEVMAADYTVLATGGVGQVYQYTTNPLVATGDGVAMAYRAGAIVKDIEFIQFHPTALHEQKSTPAFLISEAVRGFGAFLVHQNGERFMNQYHESMELAPRDVVSRAIDSEMQKLGLDHVYLDCRHIDFDAFYNHFPNIFDKCLSEGIDIRKDLIPVVPAAHYVMGGIEVNRNGETSINRLFASGEVSCTGLHGANRLASNSLLEALVYSHHIYLSLKEKKERLPKQHLPEWNEDGVKVPKELALINQLRAELRQLMSNYVAIVRSNQRLEKAQKRINIIWEETESIYINSKLSVSICELRNMVGVAHLIINKSIEQHNNKGGFYNKDLA